MEKQSTTIMTSAGFFKEDSEKGLDDRLKDTRKDLF